MIFLEFAQLIVAILFFLFMLTQIVIPICINRSMFPMFRKEKKVLLDKLKEVKEELDNVEIEKEVVEAKKVLEKEKTKIS